MILLVITAALILDQMLGEPKRFHPLVGFGVCASWLEARLNILSDPNHGIIQGTVALALLVLPPSLLAYFLTITIHPYGIVLDIAILYWAIGLKSLRVHIAPIQQALKNGELDQARYNLAQIVSRDTDQLDEHQVARATIETTLENGCDAVFGALFWYVLGGAPMVIAYRLVNTLDAMWGYRNQRFEQFGKCAARLDDILNYLPARLTALSYALCGNTKLSLNSWRRDAGHLASPNAGPVMCAGAGSLNLILGGTAFYHGERFEKPHFGGHAPATAKDIDRASTLVTRSTLLWCGLIALICLGSTVGHADGWL